jgi:glyceraldehyde 3-phosphate dehydrogenase
MRVPVANVSVVDLTCLLKKEATAEDINKAMKAASEGKMKGYLEYTEDDVVSVDFNHYPASATVDSKMTKVLGGNFCKVIAWYDNEWGYSCRVVDLIEYMVKEGL